MHECRCDEDACAEMSGQKKKVVRDREPGEAPDDDWE